MKITLTKQISKKTSFLVVPLFSDEKLTTTGPAELKKLLAAREKSKDYKGKKGESLLLTPDSATLPKKILFFGFGKKKKISDEIVRNEAAKIIKKVKHYDRNDLSVYLPQDLNPFAQAFSEGFVLANYNPAIYQTGKNKQKHQKKDIKNIEIIVQRNEKKLKSNLEKGLKIGKAVNETRDLVNGPNNYVNAESMVQTARKISRQNGYKIAILNKKQLEKLKMGALVGVNLGSDKEAKLVVLEHKPAHAKKSAPILIVGKGVTFDSGGYNLKPSRAITNMKEDMAGAAVVLGVFHLLKKLNIPHHVIGITPLTDNLIGSKAQKTNDIITTYSGKTVEVTNTDAEGRMILADAISYGIKKYNPKYVIDLATLTGACMVALGDRYAGLLGNDDKLIEKIKKSGDATGELVWHLPIHPDYRKKMKSKIADLQNSEGSGLAGASKGAAFIQEFVGKTAWAHLDIAGVTFVKDPKPYDYEAATGYGVRLLTKFFEDLK